MATTNPKNAPKIVSIFSGCGGLDYGFHTEGYETIWSRTFGGGGVIFSCPRSV